MEDLIQIVREHPILYNTSHHDYLKLSLKESVWQQIAEELLEYEDGAQVKAAWLKLRNCHRDALRRKERTGATKAWKYEREMEFLIKFMAVANKTTTENVQDPLSDNDYSLEVKASNQFSACNKRKKTNSETYETQAEIPRKHQELQKEEADRSQNASIAENDELYHFFMSMYNVTKKLPQSRQIQIKKNIFNLVTEEQEQALCSTSSAAVAMHAPAPLSLEHYFGIKNEAE